MENNSTERVFLTVIETLASRICGGTLFEKDKTLHVPHHHTDIYKYHMSRDFRDNLIRFKHDHFYIAKYTFCRYYIWYCFFVRNILNRKNWLGEIKSHICYFSSVSQILRKNLDIRYLFGQKKMNFILNVFAFKISLIYIQPCFPKTSLISQKKMKRFCQFRLKKNNVKILQNLQNYHSYKNLNKMSFQKYIFCRSFKRKCITMDRWHIFTFHEVYLNLRRQNHWQNIFLLYFNKEIQLK